MAYWRIGGRIGAGSTEQEVLGVVCSVRSPCYGRMEFTRNQR